MSQREISLIEQDQEHLAVCHLMPCKIGEIGTREVKAREYFHPIISNHDKEVLLASFRGRPLQGKAVKIPNPYRGHVISGKGESKNFEAFTYWNWDQLPSNDDAPVKALGWLEIAKAIHDPIKEIK